MLSVLLIRCLTAAPAVVLPDAVIDPALDQVYVTQLAGDAPRPVSACPDMRGPGYEAHASGGALVALGLSTGTRRWSVPKVVAPLYAYGGKVVAYAVDDAEVVFAVVEASTGKLLKRLPTGIGVTKRTCGPPQPCTLDVPAGISVAFVPWGEGRTFWYVLETTVCSAGRVRGGAALSGEELREELRRCQTSRRALRVDLERLELAPAEVPARLPRPALENMMPAQRREVDGGAVVALVECDGAGCSTQRLSLVQVGPDGRQRLQKPIAQGAGVNGTLSIDGRHLFAVTGPESRWQVYDARSGAPVKLALNGAPFTPVLVVGDVVVGTDAESLAGWSTAPFTRKWSVPLMRESPSLAAPCPNPPSNARP